jgi:hypothetical protein
MISSSVVARQAKRYLLGSRQDTDPRVGLTHASYAAALYETLMLAGYVDARKGLQASNVEQDRWGRMLPVPR